MAHPSTRNLPVEVCARVQVQHPVHRGYIPGYICSVQDTRLLQHFLGETREASPEKQTVIFGFRSEQDRSLFHARVNRPATVNIMGSSVTDLVVAVVDLVRARADLGTRWIKGQPAKIRVASQESEEVWPVIPEEDASVKILEHLPRAKQQNFAGYTSSSYTLAGQDGNVLPSPPQEVRFFFVLFCFVLFCFVFHIFVGFLLMCNF
jgi:hypothetical protein